MILFTTLFACRPDPGPRSCDTEGAHLVVAGVDPTFRSAALSVVVPATECAATVPVLVGPDPLVRTLDGHVAVVDRAGPQRVQLFAHGAYGVPAAEFAVTPRNANIHDVAQAGDHLLLTQYDGAGVAVHDLRGQLVETIDLTPFADADGLAEPDRLVWWDGAPHVVIQRMSREGGRWSAVEEGWLMPVDGAEGVEIGPNPRLARSSPRDKLGILTGLYGVADGEVTLLEAPNGALRPLLGEQEEAVDFTHAVMTSTHLVVLATSLSWDPVESTMYCIDLEEGRIARGPRERGWWVDAVAAGDDVYVAVRGFGGEGVEPGVLHVEPHRCAVRRVPVPMELDPYSIDWVH